MASPLISTKYHIPPMATQRVVRSRLIAELDELLLPGKRLGLVSALAGSGKTTLVRAWIEQFGGSTSALRSWQVAWLSLGEEDNDPGMFVAYLLAALKTASAEIDLLPFPTVEPGAYTPWPMRAVLTGVVNRLAELSRPVVMVLDDYHAISSMAIHEAMIFLIDHLPENARLVVITRAESLLPISRLRARGQLVEIREADLRFTPGEAAIFLNEIMELQLSDFENELLVERTEGWAAGLQMAALALKEWPTGHPKVEFFRNFSGSHRFVLDYLMDEVFSRLSMPTQSFLFQTAILDRFCVALCRAVVDNGSSSDLVEQQLSFLSQSHLFVIALDDENCWYRYHHLFAELLRNRMRQQARPDEIAARQRRAGDWFAAHGLNPEAIHYLLLGGSFEPAAHLIEACAQEVLSGGRLTLLNQWLATLPEAILANHPRLTIYLALARFLSGDSATAVAILEDAGHVLEKLPEDDDTHSLKRELVSILALSSIAGAHAQRVLTLAQETLAVMPEREMIPRARLLFAVGMTYAMTSDRRYYAFIKEALDLALRAGDVFLAANILNMQAMGAVFFQGQHRLAWQLYGQIIQMASSKTGETLPLPASLGYVGQAGIALEWNDLDQAGRLLEKGDALCKQTGQANPGFSALLARARLMQARGNLDAARQALEEAASQRAFDDNIAAVAQLAQAQVRLHLAEGQVELAAQCAAGDGLPLASRPGPELPSLVQEVWAVLRARVLLAQERPSDALALLGPIVPQAQVAGRMTRVAEGGLYQAMALHALHQDALQALKASLAVSQAQGITRLFLEAGRAAQAVLSAYRPRLEAFTGEADRLLQLFGEPALPLSNPRSGLVEPLTPREMDVLRLLCEGRSNREIAQELFLSLSAVKKYTGNLYGKLGVASRARAIVKARELGLI